MGALLDTDLMEMRFYLNGRDLGAAFVNFLLLDVAPALRCASLPSSPCSPCSLSLSDSFFLRFLCSCSSPHDPLYFSFSFPPPLAPHPRQPQRSADG